MSARRSLTLLVCSLVLVMTGGCGEDEPKPRIAAPSETPSVTPTPSVAASEAASEETPEEFIQRWADTSRDMQNTGDTAAYRAITGPCSSCATLVKTVEEYYAAGGYIEYGGFEVIRLREIADLVFKVWISSAPTEYKKSKGGKTLRFEGSKNTYEVVLSRRDGQFIVQEYSVLAQ